MYTGTSVNTRNMVYFLTMSDKSLNIHEAKTHLSEHLAALGAGDRIILCRRNRPIAEIRPLPSPRSVPRPVGLGKGLATLPEGFFAPLPDAVLDLFDGGVRTGDL